MEIGDNLAGALMVIAFFTFLAILAWSDSCQ